MFDSFILKRQAQSFTNAMANQRPTVSIRQAVTGADALAIAEISRRGFAETHKNAMTQTDMTHYLMETFNRYQIMSEMNERHIKFLVAEADTEIIGSVRLAKINPPHSIHLPTPIEISRLYLHPKWVGCGLGSALMRRGLEATIAAGFKSCWLTVWEGNGRALEFYRRWKFHPIGTEMLALGRRAPVGLVLCRQF